MNFPLDAFRTEAVVGPSGTLTLTGLPFRAGETVKVIVLADAPPRAPASVPEPVEPVAELDWETLPGDP